MKRHPILDEHRVLSRIEWSLEAIEDGRQDEAHSVLSDLLYELGTATTGGAA